MSNKKRTNVQLVKYMMEFSSYGALAQMFIMDAILKHAEAVAASKPKDYPKNSWVHPEAWIGVATEIAKILYQNGCGEPEKKPAKTKKKS